MGMRRGVIMWRDEEEVIMWRDDGEEERSDYVEG